MLGVVLAAALLAAPGPPPATPDARGIDRIDRIDRIGALLTPSLRAVLRPAPALVDDTRAGRLNWMAELGRRVDRQRALSSTTAWRAIMGWPAGEGPDAEAADRSLDRYPVPAGRGDPATDFAASVALAWLDPHAFACGFPLRARFLRDHDLAPSPLELDAGRCGAFERWADLDHVEAIDVIYVAQKWSDAAATMGHVIFRVRPKADAVVDGPSQALVFSYVAKDSPDTPGYLVKGMTGGLTAGLKLERFGDTFARYSLAEGRDMQVYELVLTPEERRYLLAEVFAQKRGQMQVPYAFFSTNCATMAYDTLRAVLPDLPEHASILVHPHEVVSMLMAAGRARPRGVIAARQSRALHGEADREHTMHELAGGDVRPEIDLVYARRWAPSSERAAALEALRTSLALRPPDAREARALATYLDDVLDIESFAVDQALPKPDEHASSPALDAALSLRAGLPRGPEPADPAPFPAAPIQRSGSRHVGIATAWSGSRALVSWSTAALAEEAGEARIVGLRRASRMRLLENVLTLSSAGRDVAIEEERLTVISTASWGAGVRTDAGWLAAHFGFGFGIETWSRPRDGMPFALRLSGGPGLTLAASADFARHLVLASETTLATWTGVGDGPLARATTGLALEAALPFGTPLLRLMARGRVAPAVDLDGLGLEAEARLAIDWVADPNEAIFLEVFASVAAGLPSGDGWTVGAAVAF
ncbi:MAG: DUF4105 domain-containing protein [Myxococcota bacterium]